MGLVPITGQGKSFEGSPTNTTNLADKNSIQGAIKGTLSNPALAVKNMRTLAGLARLDMFVPKRATLPVSMADFRGFPRPTLVSLDLGCDFTDFEVAGVLIVQINNKVGYDISFTIRIRQDSGRDGLINQTVTLPAGEISGYFNFGWQADYSDLEEVTLTLDVLNIIPAVYNDFNTQLIVSKAKPGGGTPSVVTWNVQQIDSLSCGASLIGGMFQVNTNSYNSFDVGRESIIPNETIGYKYYRVSAGVANDRVISVWTRNVRQEDMTWGIVRTITNVIDC
jgi:hypothetical protein